LDSARVQLKHLYVQVFDSFGRAAGI
jgi:hypothetical protein